MLDGDGRFSIHFIKPIFRKERDALFRARELATFFFVSLLDSPTRERLFRCDACRTYFVRARAPKEGTPIFRGVFCSLCKASGSAKRNDVHRNKQTSEMVKVAASVWNKWRQSRNHPDQRQWISEQINKQCGTLIKRKWVSQHLTEILEQVEGLQNATR
jgi:hypothetical protein